MIVDHSRMIQGFRFIEISKYDDGGQLTTRGQLMQGSSTVEPSPYLKYPTTLRSVGSLVLSQGKQEIAQIQGFCK